jgi:hypothetical protein
MAVSLDGGPERAVIDCVLPRSYAVAATGIYYEACDSSSGPSLVLRDLSTGRDRLLGTLPGGADVGLTVSADGKTILFGKSVISTSDLVLIEHFR